MTNTEQIFTKNLVKGINSQTVAFSIKSEDMLVYYKDILQIKLKEKKQNAQSWL